MKVKSFVLTPSALYYQLPTLSPRSNPEDSVDSCIDITSPTPSNSTNSSNSRAEAEAKETDDPSLAQRPNPLGCSGSSEEGGVVVAVDKYFSYTSPSAFGHLIG